MKEIVVVGSLNLDMVVHLTRRPQSGETVAAQSFKMFLGGKGANQAAAGARLGANVKMLGRVGDDNFGSMLLKGLSETGVDLSCVERTPGSSGLAFITTDDHAQNSIVVVSGANDMLMAEDILRQRDMLAGATVLLAQLETPIDAILQLARIASEAGVPFILDPAPARVLPRELMELVTWLTPNETESKILIGRDTGELPESIATMLLASGCRNVVLKLGAAGVYLAGKDVPNTYVEGFKVEAVDSTAAGDAFNGAFGAALAADIDPSSAARIACAVGAISVTRHGAQSSLPSREDLTSFLAEHDRSLLDLLAKLFD